MKIKEFLLSLSLTFFLICVSGCAERDGGPVLETIIKTQTEMQTMTEYVSDSSESSESEGFEIPDVSMEHEFPDGESYVTSPSETTENVTSEDFSPKTSVSAEESFEAPSETVSAQNLLSSDGGSVIVDNTQTESTEAAVPALSYAQSYHALNFKDQSGMWFSYLEYQRILKGKTEEEFAFEVETAFDNMAKLGINTVYVQIRPFGDAYYFSDYFPCGDLMTKAFDPLEIMVQKAHEKGLSVHGWINPLRIQDKNAMWALSERFVTKQWYSQKKNMFLYEDRYYLDPSSEEVRKLICDGVREILEKYKVDGIQIDDYFYPSADFSLDEESYKASGTALSQSEFRLASVSRMVKDIYDTVKKTNPTAVFGIAPMGYIDGNYETLFADVKLWCKEEGYCDYICPQIYFGFEHEVRPYEKTLLEWKNICREDIDMVVGIGAYRAGTENITAGTGKNEWLDNTDVISRQIKTAEKYGCGYALFRYDSLFCPDESVKPYVIKELENIQKK